MAKKVKKMFFGGMAGPVKNPASNRLKSNPVPVRPAVAPSLAKPGLVTKADSIENMVSAMKARRAGTPRPGMKKGGSVSSASKRADGIAEQGKTKGKII